MNFRSFVVPALALILLIAAAYSSAPWNGRVWDDDFYLTKKHLATFEGLKTMWREPTSTSHPYYPLTRTTFWIENRIWGENLFIHHFTNILLHLLNSLLIWQILRKLQVPGAWIAGAVFGVHPVGVESAAWIAERKNVLGVFFYLLSLLSFLRFRSFLNGTKDPSNNKQFYYLSLFLFLLSLLSKTAFCTLPVALLLIAWWKEGKIRSLDVRLSIPYFLLAVILGIFTIFVEKHHTGAQGPAFELTFLERCLIAGRAFWFYIGKTVFPHEVNFMYPRWEINASAWMQYLYPLLALGLVTILWLQRGKIGRGPLTAILFFLITLLPAIGFINHYLMRYTFVADHLHYLPMAGLLILIVSLLHKFLSLRLPQQLQTAFWMQILAILAFLTWKQTLVYKDNFTLYNDILSKNQQCFMAFNNRGLLYLERDQPAQAFADFNRSIEVNPEFEEAYISRGHFYFQRGKFDLAFADFNRAIRINPGSDAAYRNRGAVHFARRKYDSALADFNRSLYINPRFSRGYNARGVIFSITKRFDLALNDYTSAISLDPDYGAAYLNRSKTYLELRKLDLALADAVKARSLRVPGAEQYIRQILALKQNV